MSNSTNEEHQAKEQKNTESVNGEYQVQGQENTEEKFYVSLRNLHYICLGIGITLIGMSYLDYKDYISLRGYILDHTLIRDIGVGILTGTAISFLLNKVIPMAMQRKEVKEKKRTEEILKQKMTEITGGLSEQTEELGKQTVKLEDTQKTIIAQVTSLGIMIQTGLKRIFKERKAIINVLESLFKNEDEINIYGISLRDFFGVTNQEFDRLWNVLKRRLEQGDNLQIRILIINPQCRGAINRKKADVNRKKADGEITTLDGDVGNTIAKLMPFVERYGEKIQLCLSNCDPLMFMVQTTKVSFVQQHLFGNIPQIDDVVPIMEYEGNANDDATSSCHGALKSHFNYIWWAYSITISEYREKSFGPDRAIIDAGIKNAYYENKNRNENVKCRDRMINLINDNKTHMIWIRGVTLGIFFDDQKPIYNALKEKCKAFDIELRVIVIDTASESAKKRAFREYRGSQSFPEFTDDTLVSETKKRGDYWNSRLYNDVERTKNNFIDLKRECGEYISVNNSEKKREKKIEIKYSDDGPEGFFFITDESVLVEQYHLGKRQGGNLQNGVLSREIPVFEYAAGHNSQIHELFKDHFKWLFDEPWKSSPPSKASALPPSAPLSPSGITSCDDTP